jgi:predicted nucleic acid-binding protein
MIVVDANVIAYLYLQTARSTQVEQLLAQDSAWAAPLLWRSELRNVLALYIRKDLLSVAQAQEVMAAAQEVMEGREYEVVSFRVLALVAQSACSAYDCEFVALAQDLALPLVTVDKQILKQFPQVAVSLDAYLSM